MKIRFRLVFFILFFILMSDVGQAFVPQAPHLLYLVIEKIKQPVGIKAYQTKMVLNYEDTQTSYTELEETLYFRYPNQFRSEITSDSIAGFSVESDFEFIKVLDGVTVSQDKSPVDLYTDILLYRDHESLISQLIIAGIDTTKVSFQRYNDIICYVIGRSFEKNKPYAGLWIEKDTFLPKKYVVEKNGWIVEFLYSNWQRVSKTWYPMQTSIFLDNKLFAIVNVENFELTSQISPSLFDIDHIKQLYPNNNPGSFDENDKQVDELDKRIEEFKKLYE
ncbi:MAG: outer membrane lipoprotein-sorting protein [Desulfobacteraceae bacterium]|nr:outer membrane lipoprotein-sorting protein [Desulfobacteraceae bacterium]